MHLDALEDVFGKAWARWGPSARTARVSAPERDRAAARLVDLELPLGAVASTFAGRRVALRAAERAGGALAGVLLMPVAVALSADPSVNRDFAFVRAALSGARLRPEHRLIQTHKPTSEPSSAQAIEEEVGLLQQALATAAHLIDEHPGFAERCARAAQLELASRPAPAALLPYERPLEVLRHAALAELATGAGDFAAQVRRFRALAAEASRAPERSFWHRLMFSRAPAPLGPGPTLLFGGPLTPTERETALAAAELTSGVSEDAQEYDAPARDHVHQTEVEDDPYKENLPSHSFEKIDFADNHDGGFRKLDGVDDMEEQADSLEGVDLREMLRGGPEVESIYKAEIGDVGEIPDVHTVLPSERGVTYDEWDQKRRAYRKDWVTLYPTSLDARFAEFGSALRCEVAATTRHALGALEARRMERVARNRQLDGDDVDIESVIEEYAEHKRGTSPPGRVYVHQPRLERDTATCVLLDVSLSADSWVDNQRVLDVELAAACVLGEVAEALGDELTILAFASNTRNLCRTWTVKDWRDSWATGRARLGALAPQGYTRIGPAIRHGTAQLAAHPARNKHLLLVSDGKPTDFDRYEGGHGVHDVAWAVREARRAGIAVHALGLDPRAATLLPAMFGPGGWRILRHMADLPDALVQAYS